MFEWLQLLFSTSGFMPHGHCYLWKPELLWMNVISDMVIFLSYSAIPVAIAIFAHKRKDMPFSWVLILFSVFIITCGFTHLIAVVTVWQPAYWIAAIMKVITAVASVLTAVVLFPLLPKALAIPSPAMLQTANNKLTIQISERIKIEKEINYKNSELEAVNHALKESLQKLKQTQDQLISQEKMASLGGLVTGIAHEINTPLGIGVTAVSFMNEQARDVIKKNQANTLQKKVFDEFLDMIRSTSHMVLDTLQGAAKLIDNFKQIAVDQSSEEKRNIKIEQHLDDILISFMAKLNQSDHSVTINCESDLHIECYAGSFTQIFTHLILNSLMHGFENKQQGEIIIDIDESDTHQLIINYRDNGVGIPIEDQKRIFDPFFTTKRGQGGTGLGLHIVHNIICQQMKGNIQVVSEPGQGTRFTISLPHA
ncbi:MAG: HAMP domain-containing sensor histidine kinase [Bermanella sp.]